MNLPAMRETWVRSLGWEDPLEEEIATHSSILAWRIPWTIHGVAKSQTCLSDFHFTSLHSMLSLSSRVQLFATLLDSSPPDSSVHGTVAH